MIVVRGTHYWSLQNCLQEVSYNYKYISCMNKKKQSNLIFSNEDQHTTSPFRGNRARVLSSKIKKLVRSYQFHYNFKEYLMLLLAKILPRGQSDIAFIPQTGHIIGEQKICKELIARAVNQFQGKKFKTLPHLSSSELDDIEYKLDEGANIYRQGVIELALRQLEKKQFFRQDCQHFRENMAEKNLVLLRVERLKEEKAFHMIKEIVARHRSQKSERNQDDTIEDDLALPLQRPYQRENSLFEGTPKEQPSMQEQSGIISIMQSSLNITQNDESFLDSQFCVYHQHISKEMEEKQEGKQ